MLNYFPAMLNYIKYKISLGIYVSLGTLCTARKRLLSPTRTPFEELWTTNRREGWHNGIVGFTSSLVSSFLESTLAPFNLCGCPLPASFESGCRLRFCFSQSLTKSNASGLAWLAEIEPGNRESLSTTSLIRASRILPRSGHGRTWFSGEKFDWRGNWGVSDACFSRTKMVTEIWHMCGKRRCSYQSYVQYCDSFAFSDQITA